MSSEKALDRWKQNARKLKNEIYAIYLAYRDPRTPWYARIFAACLVAYAFSPIDLIPDFVPLLGYLDDLVLLPLGILAARRMIPPEVLEEYRNKAGALRARKSSEGKPANWFTAGVIVAAWLILAVWAVLYIMQTLK
ncbi:MAG TPA: DUF1232 domain-containing protein [Syntrophomonadaceae bacterium]|nr:DUF1232 domain-containing protein [Syntrophomonadaceae bacterium]